MDRQKKRFKFNNNRRAGFALLLLFLMVSVTACGSAAETPLPDAFRPPTINPLSTPLAPEESNPTPVQASGPIAAAPTPACTLGLVYLEDLTIPDGTVVFAGQQMDKRWSVENTGSCNWDERFSLHLVSGPGLGADEIQALYPARSNTVVVIRILFTAPDEPGAYRSAWQAYDPQGVPFGDPIFIDILVSQ